MIRVIRARLRSKIPVLGALAPVIVVVFFLFGTNTFMDAQTLTPEQEADSELGAASYSITLFDVSLAAGSGVSDQVRDQFDDAGTGHAVAINVIDFPYFKDDLNGIYFSEKDWQGNPPDRQFRLTEGRWPATAGEVVLAGHDFRDVRVGDSIKTPAGGPSLTVVGVAASRLEESPMMLAGPGTWGEMASQPSGSNGGLQAFPTFQASGGAPGDLVARVVSTLGSAGAVDPAELDPQKLAADMSSQVRTRAQSKAEVARPWTTQSPLSLWAPGLILVPLCVLVGYVILMRRLIPAARLMNAQGVRVNVAATAIWLVPVPMLLLLSALAAIAGAFAGFWLADFGAGRWGYFVANARRPGAATLVTTLGLSATLAATYALIRGQLSKPQRVAVPDILTRNLTPIRQTLGGLLATFTCWRLLNVDAASDGMVIVATAAVACALVTPELISLMLPMMPTRTLAQRLVQRQVATNRTRMAASAGIYIVLIALTVGVLTVLYSQVELMRARQPVSVPSGQVLVDNNATPFKKPDPAVIAALETIPGLAKQEPVQFYMIGERLVDPDAGVEDVRNTVGTPDLAGLSFAFDTVADVEKAINGNLTPPQETLLEDGGVLVMDAERVRIDAGHLDLVNNSTAEKVATLPAAEIKVDPSRWMDAVPFIMLRSAATQTGLKTEPAAMLYADVTDDEAARARSVVLDAGFDPRLIGIHEPTPPVVPPAALVGSALGLMLLVLAIALLATRAQVQAMRRWASRLTHLGIRTRWAKRAISAQYLWMGALSVPIGLATALATLELTRLRLPELNLVVPWGPILFVVSVMFASTSMGAAVAARRLEVATAGEVAE